MSSQRPATDAAAIRQKVLEIVRERLRKTGQRQAAKTANLQSSFEKELGLSALDLAELQARCESLFEIRLPDEFAEEMDTPAGLVKAVLEGGAEAPVRTSYRISPPGSDPVREPVSARTLVDVLAEHAEADPGRVHIHLLEEDSGQGITYGQLYEEACCVAGGLAELGLRRNETVAIMLPTSADFFFSFFGVMLAGGVPVPVYPPTRPDRIEDYVRRQIVVLRSAGVRFLIGFERVGAVVQILRVNLPSLIDVTRVASLRKSRSRLGIGSVKPADGGVLQYTSGSTGDPKGVMLPHANLLANIRAIGRAVEVRPGDALVSWLPLYSDVGLIGCWLFSLYHAIPITILSPLDFLHRPERWLWAIHDSRGALSAAPNFAYELCARRIPTWTLDGIDLSCWRIAVNAGEPVLPETVDRFTSRFEPFGFRAESMMPCFGLAEATVALTMPPVDRLPVRDRIHREAFETRGRAETAPPDEKSTLCFFSAGPPVEGQRIRVVDANRRDVPERVVGRLLFRGETAMSGYYRNPEATAAAFTEGGWIDSGDYGYLSNGEFHFTGRSRETIHKAGRAMSAIEVESALSSIPGLEPASAVAFGVRDPNTGGEQLVVVAETAATSLEEFRRIEAEILRVVDQCLGVPSDSIQLVEPGALPRTSNGKVRRNDVRNAYLKKKLRLRSRPPWLQIVRLRWQNLDSLVALGVRRTLTSMLRFSTATLESLLARGGGLWMRASGDRRAAGLAARWILKLHGQRYNLQGAQLLERDGGAVLISNRSGVLDPLVVVASVPGRVRFAERSALHGLPVSLAYLLAPLVLGHERNNTTPAAGVLRERVAAALGAGFTVVAFPDSAIGESVVRSRYRLDSLYAGLDKAARLHPTAVRERAQNQPAGERVRVRKVTMVIVRESVERREDENLFDLRNRIREAIGEYHA